MPFLIINGRIYSSDEVSIDRDVFISDDLDIEINKYSQTNAKRINAQNNIVSASLIDISFVLSERIDIPGIYYTISMAQRFAPKHGVSAIYPIISLSNLAPFQKALTIYSRHFFLTGFRLFLDPTTSLDFNALRKVLDLTSPKNPRCIDVIVPVSAALTKWQRRAIKEVGCKICVQVETAEELADIDLEDVDCVSIPYHLLQLANRFNCWIEIRLPGPQDLKYFQLGDLPVENIIARGYWTGLAYSDLSHKQQLFFTRNDNLLYMAQNQIVRYLNRGLGLPLQKCLAICTLNHGKYVGLEYDNVIRSGTRAHAIIMDGKLDIIQFI